MKKRGTSIAFLAAVTAIVLAAIIPRTQMADAQGFPVALQITSPADGTVFHRGDTVTVVVTPASGGGPYQGVLLNTDPALGLTQDPAIANPSGASYQFSFTVPSTAVIGMHFVNAVAGTPGQQPVRSADIYVDIEPSAAVTVTSVRIDPSSISLGPQVDDHVRLKVYGTFSDGSVSEITKSTRITYVSNDPTIATVSSTGLVTTANSTNRGVTTIVVHFGNLNTGAAVSNKKIPVSP